MQRLNQHGIFKVHPTESHRIHSTRRGPRPQRNPNRNAIPVHTGLRRRRPPDSNPGQVGSFSAMHNAKRNAIGRKPQWIAVQPQCKAPATIRNLTATLDRCNPTAPDPHPRPLGSQRGVQLGGQAFTPCQPVAHEGLSMRKRPSKGPTNQSCHPVTDLCAAAP